MARRWGATCLRPMESNAVGWGPRPCSRECARGNDRLDCAVDVDGSDVNVIIGARIGECTARFWSGRSLSNYHRARRRGCLWVESLPCGLHVYAGEPRSTLASSNCSTASWHCDLQFELSVGAESGWLHPALFHVHDRHTQTQGPSIMMINLSWCLPFSA